MSLSYFAKPSHLKLCILKGNVSQVAKRITGIVASNALGEKISMFVIGKSTNQVASSMYEISSVATEPPKKAWMDETIFEEWLRELDCKFERQGRKIITKVNNWPAHP